jgi:hypothetical protein
MLPALPSPHRLPWRAALAQRLSSLGLCLTLLLPLGLTGCGLGAQPPRSVLLQALALQIQLTQAQVAQALDLQPAGLPEVSRVRVEEQQAMPIGEAAGLRLAGHFDWRLAGDPIRVDSPFELFLQQGERGQSWRLARPLGSRDGASQDWRTDPLPLPGSSGLADLG